MLDFPKIPKTSCLKSGPLLHFLTLFFHSFRTERTVHSSLIRSKLASEPLPMKILLVNSIISLVRSSVLFVKLQAPFLTDHLNLFSSFPLLPCESHETRYTPLQFLTTQIILFGDHGLDKPKRCYVRNYAVSLSFMGNLNFSEPMLTMIVGCPGKSCLCFFNSSPPQGIAEFDVIWLQLTVTSTQII
ncbi:hypothetical protein O6H91_10G036000 [Diphasiastrum complanatum]|uniref:Uncharacterized protein n=1 Tax=Diphasiastrum complanatum TaxID=34168 RepID=A0ACC2CFY9_DIPCM|nr:hypothetical protein O6H91_10G036000 [Diphasiastrum complanatum]